MTEKTKIFISYSRRDQDFAQQLVAVLVEAGFDAAIDSKDVVAGEPWRERLAGLIATADELVFLISPDSVTSEICDWELSHAELLGKRTLPVVCRATKDAEIPARLAKLNYVFLDGSKSTSDELAKLLAALNEDTAWVRRHTVLVARARHWQTVGQAAHAILRGQDLLDAEDLVLKRPAKPATPEISGVLQDFVAFSRATERKERDQLRRTVGLAYAEPVKTAYRAGEFETAIKLAAHGAMLADDLNFSLVPELWDAVAPSIVACPTRARLAGHNKETTTYASDGAKRYLITGAEDGSINVLDLRTRRCLCRPELHNSQVMTIAISPDGAMAVSASIAGDLIVWRTLEGSTLRQIPLRGIIATNAQWSENGAYLAIGLSVGDSKGKVLLLDGASFASIGSTAELPAIVNAISFNSSATTMAVGLFADRQKVDTAIMAFAIPAITQQFAVTPHGEKVKQLLFSPCGRFLISNSEQELYFETEDQSVSQSASGRTLPWVQIWSASTGSVCLALLGHTRVVHDVSFSASGRQLVTSAADGSARLWDIETGNELKRLYSLTQNVYRAVLSSDGQRVATLSDDQAVRVWSAPTGELLREFREHQVDRWSRHAHQVVRACPLFFLDEDRTVCAASLASGTRLIDTAKSFLIAEHWHHDGPVSSVRFSPDAGHVVSIGRLDLICFEPGAGAIRSRAYLAHPTLTYRQDNLTFYANGHYLAVITDEFRSYSHDVAVQCFDLKSGDTVFDADLKDGADYWIVTSRDPAGIAVFQKDGVAVGSHTVGAFRARNRYGGTPRGRRKSCNR
jgi:WD40 repeat protein